MPDNAYIKLGTGDDLQIYHDGTNSYATSGTGQFFLTSSNSNIWLRGGEGGILSADGSEYLIRATSNGSVKLYHNNGLKLETTATGIDVTGGINLIAADGVSIRAKESLTIDIDSDDNQSGRVFSIRDNTTNLLQVAQTGVIDLIGTVKSSGTGGHVQVDNGVGVTVRETMAATGHAWQANTYNVLSAGAVSIGSDSSNTAHMWWNTYDTGSKYNVSTGYGADMYLAKSTGDFVIRMGSVNAASNGAAQTLTEAFRINKDGAITMAGALTSKSHIVTGTDNTAFEVKTNHSGNPSAMRVAGTGSINGISGSFQNFYALNVMQDSGAQNSIYAAGNIKTDGNINIGTSGKGISFGATSDTAGMTSELLDDYEEGTWTPDLTNQGSTVTTVPKLMQSVNIQKLVTVVHSTVHWLYGAVFLAEVQLLFI